jgi:hypothetical protein
MCSKLTAMTTFLAASFLLLLLVGIWALLEHNHHRTGGLPRLPFGADADKDMDLWRVRHDLDVGHTSSRSGRPA